MLNALHAPWWLIVLLGIVAFICLYNANARTNIRVKQSAIGVLILVAALAAIRILIPTDIERVEQSTRDICQSAIDGNWPRFAAFLAPDVTAAIASNAVISKPDDVTDAAKLICDAYHPTAIKVTSLQSTQTGDAITTICHVTTVQSIDGSDQPLPSGWSMQWRRTGGGWLLDKVTMTDLAGQPASDVADLLPLPRH